MRRAMVKVIVCRCCKRQVLRGGVNVDGGKVHLECYLQHHSSPTETHGCELDQ